MSLKTKIPKEERQQSWLKFQSFLKARGLKVTEQRRLLLQFLVHLNEHIDADTLYQGLKNKDAGISRGTVYRTLDLLVQCGLVRKSSFGEDHANYEIVHQDEHHDHLICIECNKVIEFYRADLEKLQDSICQHYKFIPLHHSHQIFGICNHCRSEDADQINLSKKISRLNA